MKFDQGDAAHRFRLGDVEDEVFVINDDYTPYKPVIQKIRRRSDGTYLYRFGYFVVARRNTGTAAVSFGQYCLMVSEEDTRSLMAQAAAKGWPGFVLKDSQ